MSYEVSSLPLLADVLSFVFIMYKYSVTYVDWFYLQVKPFVYNYDCGVIDTVMCEEKTAIIKFNSDFNSTDF